MTANITMIGRKMTTDEYDIIKEIRRNNTRKKKVIQTLKKEDGLTWEEDEVVYIQGRIYMPNSKKIREEILEENHNSVDVEHPRQQKMLELIKRNYWWPGIKEDVKKYIQGYFKCQLLQSQDLRVSQVKKPCIRLIQENLIENSVQDCLPYILIPNGPCELFLAYSK